jgi:hypothetical protein
MTVAICRLMNGWSLYQWLCAKHRKTRATNGWTVEVIREQADLPCADCADRKYVVVAGK